MIPFRRRSEDSWGDETHAEPESFWPCYSDLMAGVVMVLALNIAVMRAGLESGFAKPTERVNQWRQVVQELRGDKELQQMKSVRVDPQTGALQILSDDLQFGFNDSRLGEHGRELLREVVPKYLAIVRKKKGLEGFIETVEIAGHTDRLDLHYANPRISRDRAAAVLDFLLAEPKLAAHKDFLKGKAITVGYADTRFPPTEVCPLDRCAEARRVEIAVRLKTSEVLGEFMRILENLKLVGGQ
ncbi:MAG: OmpA family protein [Deferrisomatales bacterium]